MCVCNVYIIILNEKVTFHFKSTVQLCLHAVRLSALNFIR